MIYFLLVIFILLFGCDPSQSNPQDKAALSVGECLYLPSKYVQSIDGELKTEVTYEKYCLKLEE